MPIILQPPAEVPPITSTDNAVPRFDGTSGVLQDSGVTLDDSDNLDVPGVLSIGDALPSATADHRLQVDGIILHDRVWKDLTAPFTSTSTGGAAPTLVTLVNGVRLYRFGAGDSVHASYHVGHDYSEGTDAFHHVHWFPESAMSEGDTVTWRILYVLAKGHEQGESLTAARSSFDIVYTSPVGGTLAGEHIVSEASDLQGYILEEADTIVLAEIELLSKTFGGNVLGIEADLHYQADREGTIGKEPDFNVAD